jgi:hypothetical protein
MNELEIMFNLQSPQEKSTKINISICNNTKEELLYKFMVGLDGTWENLSEFSSKNSVEWQPSNEGSYVVMVQAKRKNSNRSFNYVSKADYLIGKEEERLIRDVFINKESLTIGDKLNVLVEVSRLPVVYRYWIKEKDNWELIKDYSADNSLNLTVKSAGAQELLVECKSLESKNKFDDSKVVRFTVEDVKHVEITDFRCLIDDRYVGNELVFQVEAAHSDKRMILYKFVKINPDGTTTLIQDYSTKRMVSFVEENGGEYKLLCLAKDMYSQKDYDDRALLNYKIKPYKDIFIQSFTTDLTSPQLNETKVTLRAVVLGGRELLYRFRIDGNYGEDSGYIRSNTYVWETKKSGKYKLELWVKDISFEGNYEAAASMDFTVDEECKDPVVINDIIMDRSSKLLKGETINIKVLAAGGTDLRYSFHVKKENKEVEKIDYGTCNWVNFTPEEKGLFELEARVKDKYSLREFDSHTIVYVEAFNYIPAAIDYVLSPAKEHFMVGDTVTYTVITQNTNKTLLRYVLNINGHKVEETDFIKDKKYKFTPKCSGVYILDIYARNEDSDKEFDSKKEIKLVVHDAVQITNTKIQCDKTKPMVNETVTFTVNCEGGKEVVYQFYLMEKGDWILVQNYSRKNYYSFIPFAQGVYRVLALCKSSLKRCNYEDYDIMEFKVE